MPEESTVETLTPKERVMLLRAWKTPHPRGAIAVDTYPHERLPAALAVVESLVAKRLMLFRSSEAYSPHPQVMGVRSFYDVTQEGVRLAAEFEQALVRGIPEDIAGFKQWVRTRAHLIVTNTLAGEDARPALDRMVKAVNDLPTRFVIVAKSDESTEEWTFDVVQRVGLKR